MSSSREFFSWICVLVFPIYKVGCYSLLYWKELFFLKRNKAAILVSSIAGWLAYLTLVASISNKISCGFIYVASSSVALLSMGPQLIRALHLRARFDSSNFTIEEEISSREQRTNCGQRKGALSTIPSGSECKSASGGEDYKSGAPSNLVAVSESRKQSDLVIDRAHKSVNAIKWLSFVLAPILLVFAWYLSSMENSNPLFMKNFDDCITEPSYFNYTNLLFAIVSLILAVMACVSVKNVEDELYLQHEITRTALLFGFMCIVIQSVRIAGYKEVEPLLLTVQQMIQSCSMIIIPCCPESTVITKARWWVKRRISPASTSAVPGYAQSLPKYHRGSTRASVLPTKSIVSPQLSDQMAKETNTSWDAGLCILLSSEGGINSFTRHCAREFSSENIRFWCAVNDFRAKFDDTRTSTSFSDDNEHNIAPLNENGDIGEEANEIYKKFIGNKSKTQVNLSSQQKNEIKKAIESGAVTKDTFDVAQKEIFSVMSRDSYPRYLTSKRNRKLI
ncbi:hypothetical protein HJC23_008438 [Cyclotella cryptica]|uniref:RGS domain-containing protein n=1 Tax=Cyclotella cryptica TaxID=29204 RepID=A0ABD3NM61_9STRA|eukprot:CCRYP_020621-RA/>CCRYP_020621-RA protein AED:0.26 eAED:0.26 QI:0/-1/0/1/-1/1/1/0/505